MKLTDDQWYLLLSTVAVAHVIEYMKGKDNSKLEELIKVIVKELEVMGKKDIFNKVFMEMKK